MFDCTCSESGTVIHNLWFVTIAMPLGNETYIFSFSWVPTFLIVIMNLPPMTLILFSISCFLTTLHTFLIRFILLLHSWRQQSLPAELLDSRIKSPDENLTVRDRFIFTSQRFVSKILNQKPASSKVCCWIGVTMERLSARKCLSTLPNNLMNQLFVHCWIGFLDMPNVLSIV